VQDAAVKPPARRPAGEHEKAALIAGFGPVALARCDMVEPVVRKAQYPAPASDSGPER
jgi:hypothetical protein